MLNFNIFEKITIKLGLKRKRQNIGIHNTGKNNTFINNTIEGCDVGFKDEGEGTLAVDNKIENKK